MHLKRKINSLIYRGVQDFFPCTSVGTPAMTSHRDFSIEGRKEKACLFDSVRYGTTR
jgi:hypothetical protein